MLQSAMPLKDLLNLLLTVALLMTSISAATLSYAWQARARHDQFRKAFDEALLGLASLRGAHSSLRMQLGEEIYAHGAGRPRQPPHVQRDFYLDKALHLIRARKIKPTYFESSLIAHALKICGRSREASEQLLKAMNQTKDPLARARTRRDYGVLLFDMEQPKAARLELAGAVDDFIALTADDRYVRELMFYKAAEVLIWIMNREVEGRLAGDVEADLAKLDQMVRHIQDATLQRVYAAARRKLEDRLAAPKAEPTRVPEISLTDFEPEFD